MTKFLLILTLATSQLLSGSMGTLFLCVGEDGSVCLDRGEESCDCCQDTHDHDHCCSLEERTNSAILTTGACDPCGCIHIQISQAQDRSVSKATSLTQTNRSLSVDLLPFKVLVGTSALENSVRTRFLHPPAATFELAFLATTVLRC